MTTTTTYNGLRAIDIDGQVYFSPSDYNNNVPEPERWGYDAENRLIFQVRNGTSVSASRDDGTKIQVHAGETFIHTSLIGEAS